MTIEELYHEAVKPLPPLGGFRLATLILNEIPPQSIADVCDARDELDMTDVAVSR